MYCKGELRGFFVCFTAVLVCAAATALVVPTSANVCNNESTGLLPVTELVSKAYRGYRGMLYPTSNLRPSAHESAGRAQAASIVPLNSNGASDPKGRIVMLSIGMSNTRAEFSAFAALTSKDPDVNPRLTLINGAKSGSPGQVIAHPETLKGLQYWATIDTSLSQAGLTPAQVQVAWVKVAEANPQGGFPKEALRLKANLVAIARILKQRFPNVRLAYFSSRIYAGYANTTLNPEPYAYESGFAVKWLIEDQIAGTPQLNFDARRGSVEAPWLAWGPYLWADGSRAGGGGLTWACTDFRSDGTHPSESGSFKVARLLLDFFQHDTTASGWFGGR